MRLRRYHTFTKQVPRLSAENGTGVSSGEHMSALRLGWAGALSHEGSRASETRKEAGGASGSGLHTTGHVPGTRSLGCPGRKAHGTLLQTQGLGDNGRLGFLIIFSLPKVTAQPQQLVPLPPLSSERFFLQGPLRT